MRHILTLLYTVMALAPLSAQQIYKCCNNTNSSFLLGSMNYARHNQGLYLPSDFQTSAAGNISRIYYRYGTTNVVNGNTLTQLTISMVHTQQTSFANNMFITGVTPVFQRQEHTIPGGAPDTWFAIELDEPFPYDPSLPLVVDIRFDSSAVLMTCRSVNTPGRKLQSGDLTSPTGSGSSQNLHDFGFDLDVFTGVPSEGPMIQFLHAEPQAGILHIRLDAASSTPTQAQVFDTRGRSLARQTIGAGEEYHTMDLSSLARGMYVLRLVQEDGQSSARSFVLE